MLDMCRLKEIKEKIKITFFLLSVLQPFSYFFHSDLSSEVTCDQAFLFLGGGGRGKKQKGKNRLITG